MAGIIACSCGGDAGKYVARVNLRPRGKSPRAAMWMGKIDGSVPKWSTPGERLRRRPHGPALVQRMRTQGRRVAFTAVVAAQILRSTAGPILGAPATPRSVPTPTCDLRARTLDEITALLATTEIATPAATTDGQTVPSGVPADDEMSIAMEQVVNLWLACQNAGEPLRGWSLFSDGYLSRLLSRQGGLSGEANRVLSTPAPVADEAAVVLAVAGERLLPDGRYGATVTIEYPSVPMPKRFFFYFTEVDGRLVIDGILGEISFSVP